MVSGGEATLFEHFSDGLGLPFSAFKEDKAVLAQNIRPAGYDGAVEIKAVLSPVKSLARLKILYRGIELRYLRRGDIGRIGYDYIESAQTFLNNLIIWHREEEVI